MVPIVLTGTKGIFLSKRQDGTIQDISGFFEGFLNFSDDKEFKEKVCFWIDQELIQIQNDEYYKEFDIDFKIQLLTHINRDYRYLKNKEVIKTEIERLLTFQENELRGHIYNECHTKATVSKEIAIDYLNEWISDTRREKIHLQIKINGLDNIAKQLDKRLELLNELKIWLNESPHFEDKTSINIKIDSQLDDQNYTDISDSFPIDKTLNKKMILLNKLGIIELLTEYIAINSVKPTKNRLALLIGQIIGSDKVTSIERFLSIISNPSSPDKNNPNFSKNKNLDQDVSKLIAMILNQNSKIK